MMFEGAQQWLQYRVWVGMPPQYRLMLETMDVLTKPKVSTAAHKCSYSVHQKCDKVFKTIQTLLRIAEYCKGLYEFFGARISQNV